MLLGIVFRKLQESIFTLVLYTERPAAVCGAKFRHERTKQKKTSSADPCRHVKSVLKDTKNRKKIHLLKDRFFSLLDHMATKPPTASVQRSGPKSNQTVPRLWAPYPFNFRPYPVVGSA